MGRASTVYLSYTFIQAICETNHTQRQMEGAEVEELMVHLERNMDLSIMENILRSSWKEIGEVEVKWVRDNAFIIIVQDESNVAKILDQVSWVVWLGMESGQKLYQFEISLNLQDLWLLLQGNEGTLVQQKWDPGFLISDYWGYQHELNKWYSRPQPSSTASEQRKRNKNVA
ncbi:hypothetical protein DVH24_042786 [Malus domestica]|uniref:Uncharacterized protein n=1 Tax=Malus domestica TaxID=3750 RepID=A0A498HZC7_MALDO|nr:hypothetical protein DVH24_042786 [Malus domestica]